jgi:hypothetical protein
MNASASFISASSCNVHGLLAEIAGNSLVGQNDAFLIEFK